VDEDEREALVLRSAQDSLRAIRETFERAFWAHRDSGL
jgi:hypothetical protein